MWFTKKRGKKKRTGQIQINNHTIVTHFCILHMDLNYKNTLFLPDTKLFQVSTLTLAKKKKINK